MLLLVFVRRRLLPCVLSFSFPARLLAWLHACLQQSRRTCSS
jgi:hypothetical protein